MKKTILISILLSSTLLSKGLNKIDSLLLILDQRIENIDQYTELKEQKLDKLKDLLRFSYENQQKYNICGKLFDEYSNYKSDSALAYARIKLELAEKLGGIRNLNDARLNLASIMGLTGLYKESIDLLETIHINNSPELKAYYMHVYRTVYGFMADYSVSTIERKKFNIEVSNYRDSLLEFNSPLSDAYIMVKTDQLISDQKYEDALKILETYYPTIQNDKHTKAIIAYSIANAYQGLMDREHEKEWLTVSAIHDIESANKEYISLQKLANYLFENGDINRAYKYMKRSLDDALFCNARLRTFEISKMMPIIDKAYEHQLKARQALMSKSLISISILTLLLLIAIYFIWKQMRKLGIARNNENKANEQLKKLIVELTHTNTELKNSNNDLRDSNLIKEEYIGRYMDQCSEYIDKLDNFRKKLNKTASIGKMEDVLKTLKSNNLIDEELKDFYNNFDITFLRLFPSFIDEFKALLESDEIIQLKQGQIMNTELRIFALIRLGIHDTLKISHFLRCSMSTVYNYRTKIRNHAVCDKDEFDLKLMKIGILENA